MEASSEGRVRQRLSPGLPRLAITRGARCTESAPGPGCPDCSVSTRPSQCDPKSSALPTCWARASAHCAVPPSPPGYGNSLEPSHRIPFRNSWQGWKWSSFPPPLNHWTTREITFETSSMSLQHVVYDPTSNCVKKEANALWLNYLLSMQNT